MSAQRKMSAGIFGEIVGKSALALVVVAMLAAEARANESLGFEQTYLGETLNLNLKGRDQVVSLRQYLRLQQGMPIDSLTIIAASARGRGNLRVEADGRTIFNTQVDEQFAPIHIAVSSLAYQGFRDLRILTDGNIMIAHMGVAVRTMRPVPGGPGPISSHGPGPMPGPGGGRPMPGPIPGSGGGFPGNNGGYPPPMPNGGGVIGGPVRGIVSQGDFAVIMNEIKRESFDSKRSPILAMHADRLMRLSQLLTMEQAAESVGAFDWDAGRLEALTKIRPLLLVRLEAMEQILSKFQFNSGREQARNLLLR